MQRRSNRTVDILVREKANRSHYGGTAGGKTSLHRRLVVRGQIGFNLVQMVVGVGQSIMDIRRPEAGILLYDLLDTHALPVAPRIVATRIRVPTISGWPPHRLASASMLR